MNTSREMLSCIEINPKTNPIGSVIWLHGLGADGNDFAPMIPALQLPTTLPIRFVFPNAPLKPVTINNGYIMPAWYDILSMNIHHRADQQGINESVLEIGRLIEQEEKRGIPSNKIILAGFSQGAVIALTTGLSYPKPLAGILALSGYLPFTETLLQKPALLHQAMPIFLAHGTEDTIVPYALGVAAHDALKKTGFSADWHAYRMAHSVCDEEIRDISSWLKTVFV